MEILSLISDVCFFWCILVYSYSTEIFLPYHLQLQPLLTHFSAWPHLFYENIFQSRQNCLKTCTAQLWLIIRHFAIFHVFNTILCQWRVNMDFNITFTWTIFFTLCRKAAIIFFSIAISFNQWCVLLTAAELRVTSFWDARWAAQETGGLVVNILRLDGHRVNPCFMENLPYFIGSILVISRCLALDMKSSNVLATCKLPHMHLMKAANPWDAS